MTATSPLLCCKRSGEVTTNLNNMKNLLVKAVDIEKFDASAIEGAEEWVNINFGILIDDETKEFDLNFPVNFHGKVHPYQMNTGYKQTSAIEGTVNEIIDFHMPNGVLMEAKLTLRFANGETMLKSKNRDGNNNKKFKLVLPEEDPEEEVEEEVEEEDG